jgi:L-ascorbate metabolism protein UlaG (beta-lactamase superfamily)
MMLRMILVLAVCMAIGLLMNGCIYQKYPAYEPMAKKSFFTVMKWRATSERAKWPEHIEQTQFDKPPARVPGKELRISYVNHSTVLVQTENLNVLLDPIWSERASPFTFIGPKRVHEPGMKWDDLPRVDMVLISHSHYDHLDIETVRRLVKRYNPLFIVPKGVDEIILRHAPQARVAPKAWSEAHVFNIDMTVYLVPAQHWSARSLWDRNKTLWGGFVMTTPHGHIYYSGDTGFGSGKLFDEIHQVFGPVRLAILPIGAYAPRWFMKDSHITPDEAVDAFKRLKAQNALGVHWGTFQLSDEAIDAPVNDLKDALDKAKIPESKFCTIPAGTHWEIK